MNKFNVFQNPLESEAPRFITERNGLKVMLPYDPEIITTRVGMPITNIIEITTYKLPAGRVIPLVIEEETIPKEESQLFYDEVKTGLIWLSIEPKYPNHKHFAVSKKGNKIYRNFVPFEAFKV